MTQDMSVAPPQGALPAAPPAEALRLSWAKPQGMIGLSIVNFCLRIMTLGIYQFWGKTEVRRRIWSAARINGEPLHYTGTGKELFLGFLVVLAVVVVPGILVSFGAVLWLGPTSPWIGVFQVVFYTFFFFLTGFAIQRAQRYRLTRTQWRGIRGGLEGSGWSFAWTYFWTALLIPLTLGWISPWRTTKLQGLLSNGMRFGNRPFRFDAKSGPLYPRFVGVWFGGLVLLPALFGALALIYWTSVLKSIELGIPSVPTGTQIGLTIATFILFSLLFGLVSAWYRAGVMNHFAAHTWFEGARFRANADAPSLIWLAISNFLIVMLSLGLLGPVAQARSARYFVQRLAIDGEIPLAAIMQGAEDNMKRGEGLAQAFDVDAF